MPLGVSQTADPGCAHLYILHTQTGRVRVKEAVGGDSTADTLESLDANNTPLTLRETGVRRFHVAHT